MFETERLAFRLGPRTLTPQIETGERGLTFRDPLSPPTPHHFWGHISSRFGFHSVSGGVGAVVVVVL